MKGLIEMGDLRMPVVDLRLCGDELHVVAQAAGPMTIPVSGDAVILSPEGLPVMYGVWDASEEPPERREIPVNVICTFIVPIKIHNSAEEADNEDHRHG